MRRLFWIGLGVAAGVVATRKAARAVEQLTPAAMTDRLADSLGNLGDAIRQFGEDVRDAMWDREDELRDALGVNDLDAPDPADAAANGRKATTG